MRTGRNFAYNLLGAGLPLLLAIVAVPAIGRDAGLGRLGFLAIVWAVIGYLGFLDLGLSRVFARRVAVASVTGRLDVETAFLRWIARRLMLLCVAVTVVLALAVPPTWLAGNASDERWLDEVHAAWVVLAASVPALVLSNLWRGAMEGREAFGIVNLYRVFLGAWTFGIPLLILPFTHALPALVGGIVVGRWVSLALHRGWCRRNLPWNAGSGDERLPTMRADLRHALVEGAWFTVSGIVGPMMVVFDRFVLGAVAALATVAVYAIPQEIVLRLLLVPGLLAGVLFPRLAVLAQDDAGGHAALVDRATRFTVVLQARLCFALVLAAQPLLAVWLGTELAVPAAPILRWLLIGCMLNTAAQVPFAHLQASGRSWLTARIHLAEIVPYAAALFAAVLHFGALGAAGVWSARCLVDTVLMLAATRAIDRRSLSLRAIAALCASTAFLAAAAWAFTAAPPPASISPLAAGAVFAAATAAVVALGLRRAEIVDLVHRLRRIH